MNPRLVVESDEGRAEHRPHRAKARDDSRHQPRWAECIDAASSDAEVSTASLMHQSAAFNPVDCVSFDTSCRPCLRCRPSPPVHRGSVVGRHCRQGRQSSGRSGKRAGRKFPVPACLRCECLFGSTLLGTGGNLECPFPRAAGPSGGRKAAPAVLEHPGAWTPQKGACDAT